MSGCGDGTAEDELVEVLAAVVDVSEPIVVVLVAKTLMKPKPACPAAAVEVLQMQPL